MKHKRMLALLLVCVMILATGCHTGDAFNMPPAKKLDKYESKEAAYEAVWGEMVDFYGEYLQGELTFEEQTMINFPAIDRSNVFWITSGVHFHSIDWCYGLEGDIADTGDDEVFSGSSSKAVIEGMTACSKCVGTDPLPRLKEAIWGDAKHKAEKKAQQEAESSEE